ncbi:sensor domain-containing diguanylate cyclase [Marinomonas ostreistagni]|uniref:sensor domain-containing diguanylate cyclase n=1 Tax=Marinomonas ostreistagni TaxID=359209 RepID=UPI0019500540|nr:sensor domain-containing diguanylate cyclase [Marinomonas ostreistagni]MBM6550573.1 diguanylate cyclase [Marinomonas ostreistagni]
MKQMSLWGLIVIPFALLAVLGGITVYWFSTVTIANVSDNVGLHYMREIETRVYDRVNEFMAPLNTIAEINQQAIGHHPEWLDDLDFVAGRLYEQALPYPYMTFISFATADGRYVNSTRDPFGDSHHVATNYTGEPGSLAAFHYDPLNYIGARMLDEPAYDGYDPRKRPFYQDAMAEQGMSWSSITPYFGYQSLGVGLSTPVYDQQGQLLGVTATSVALIALDKYLQSIGLVEDSYVFLAEPNGNLIATSNNSALYNEDGGLVKRVSLATHTNPVFHHAGERLTPGSHELMVGHDSYLYNVRAIDLPYGKTWYVGVLVPESYYAGILKGFSQVLVLVLIILFVSFALAGSLIASFIGQPILRLNEAITANSLTRIRQLPQPLSRVREINSLGRRLQHMAHELSDTLQNLEQKVAQRTSHLKDENELLLEQSTTDELTKLYNRRGFNLLSEQAHAQAQQQQRSLCMVLCDIDHFKLVNDNHGHNIGDQVLEIVAKVLTDHFRPTDIVARYGGEEFILITVGMTQAEVTERLQAVSRVLKQHPMPHQGTITLSYGMTHLESSAQMSLDDMIHDVDTKLYQAKNTGRDKIVS